MAMIPHPGELISGTYLEPNALGGRELAENLGVAESTLSRVKNGSGRPTPEIALRLSKALGRSPVSRLAMRRELSPGVISVASTTAKSSNSPRSSDAS